MISWIRWTISRCPMTEGAPHVFTPRTLAARWHCSERHVRNMIDRGEIRYFRLGGKLLRIPADAVDEIESLKFKEDKDG